MLELSDQTKFQIQYFIDLVHNELTRIPYPPGYRVSAHWRSDLASALANIKDLQPIDIVKYAMTSVGFGCEATGVYPVSRELESVYPELRPISEAPFVDAHAISDNRTTSPSIEKAFGYYHNVRRTVGSAPLDTVLEVGAGHGPFARLMHLLGTKCFVIVDLPESLAFSHTFLRANFPKAKIKVIRYDHDAQQDFKRFDFVFCPVQLFKHLQLSNLDLFVNMYSLGEMPQGAAYHVLEQVERLQPKFIYWENILLTDKTNHYDAGQHEANDMALRLQPTWWPRLFNLTSETIGVHHRFLGYVGLVRVLVPTDELVANMRVALAEKLLPDEAMKYLYFLAQWDKGSIPEFFATLQELVQLHRADVAFEKIGEVRYLRRLLEG